MPSVITYPGVFDGVYSPIVFSRASSGTYFNSAGVLTTAVAHAPRIDYNPSTLVKRGMLIEEARTNIAASSVYTANTNGWTNGVIGGTGAIATAAINSPAGTTAGVFNISGLNSSSYVGVFPTVTASANARTGSVFVRNNGGVKFQIRLVFQTGGTFVSYGTEYDFNTTAFQDGIGATTAPTSRSVTNVGNGWLRISITGSDNGTGNTLASLQFWGTATTTNYNYLMWGAQIEEASGGASAAFPTSYIPTTTAAVTRSADVASVGNITPWINQTEGSIYVELQSLSSLTPTQSTALFKYPHAYVFDAGTTDSAVFWYGVGADLYIGGTYNSLSTVPSGINKLAVSMAATGNQSRSSLNGAAAVNRSGTSPGNVTSFSIGRDPVSGGNQFLNGWIRRITYYPRTLTATELQTLTT